MFTGLKAKEMIGAPGKGVSRPSLNKYRVFVQNGGGGQRCLKQGTSLLYEVDNACKCFTSHRIARTYS